MISIPETQRICIFARVGAGKQGYEYQRAIRPPKLYFSAFSEAHFFSASLRFPLDTTLGPTLAGSKPALDSASPNVSLSSAVFPSGPTSPALAVSCFPPGCMQGSISNSCCRVDDLVQL